MFTCPGCLMFNCGYVLHNYNHPPRNFSCSYALTLQAGKKHQVCPMKRGGSLLPLSLVESKPLDNAMGKPGWVRMCAINGGLTSKS